MDNCNNTPKAPFDPGWNDPPTLSYNVQQTTPNRPRNFLNKRVAFPLSGVTANATPPLSVNLPPAIPSAPPVPLPSVHSESAHEGTDIDSETALKETKDILLKFLEDNSELGPKADNIKKRLCVMEEMWSSGKLNKSIHMQMRNLAHALQDDDPSKANDIHRALMVDHVSAVGTWMPGIKHLIYHCIARSELLAIDNE